MSVLSSMVQPQRKLSKTFEKRTLQRNNTEHSKQTGNNRVQETSKVDAKMRVSIRGFEKNLIHCVEKYPWSPNPPRYFTLIISKKHLNLIRKAIHNYHVKEWYIDVDEKGELIMLTEVNE